MPALRVICPNILEIAISEQPDVRREALAAGADAFLSPERLLAAIHTFQRHKK
jgi:hypothetical protein